MTTLDEFMVMSNEEMEELLGPLVPPMNLVSPAMF
jgi:hypothetical protein